MDREQLIKMLSDKHEAKRIKAIKLLKKARPITAVWVIPIASL